MFHRLSLASVVFLILPLFAHAENWPQWRGPNRDGISSEKKLPAEWDEKKNVVWTAPLPGMGSSTPAIWGDKIFLTTEDGDDVALLCLNTDGKQLWKTGLDAKQARKRFRMDEANQASASPSTDGRHVWAFFGTGDFICCDFQGKIVWRFDAQERYGKFQIGHGMHITPLLDGERLYFSLLHSGEMDAGTWWVIALDKATGKEIWKVRRETDGAGEGKQSYASPILWRGKSVAAPNEINEYLVVHGCDYATAHRLTDGSEIWRLGDLNPKKKYDPTFRIIASPAASPDLIVVPSARSGPLVGVKPEARGLIKEGSSFERWRLPSAKTPDVCIPLIHDGLVYICREYQRDYVLICIDAVTGKELYNEKLHKARYRASPVYADGKIYLTARDGLVTVVKAGPRFEVLATNQLPDDVAASPAIANGRIYFRGWKALYAISVDGK